MRPHRIFPPRKKIAGLIVLAIFFTGLAHGLLDGASECEAEGCFLCAPLATAPCMAEIRAPVWLHARVSLRPAHTSRPGFSSHLSPARAPPFV